MARVVALLLAGWLIAGTVDSPRSYAISGIIRDTRHRPLRAARVDVIAPGFEGTFVVSDDAGRYRIHDLSGGVRLEASRAGYFSSVRAIAPAGDAVVDFVLQPIQRAAIGEVIRGELTTDSPTCFGRGYEDAGPGSRGAACYRLLVTASTAGALEVALTWDRPAALALDLIAPDGRSIQSWAGIGRAKIEMPVQERSTYEVRVLVTKETHGLQHEFEIRTAWR